MIKMVLLSRLFAQGMEILREKVELDEVYTDEPLEYLEKLRQADVILLGNQKFGRDIIEKLPRLKILAKQGSGYDNIDVEAATERNIPVVLSAGANANAVAEHVIALVLAANKNLHYYGNAVRRGEFSARSQCRTQEIGQKTIGLVGCGNIGVKVGSYAAGLGMKVIIYDPYLDPGRCREMGFSPCETLEELLEKSDTVSVHVPLTEQTRGMIGEQEISRMKDGAVLVNCSRGGVVDEAALYTALKEEKLFSAGIDVFEKEPADSSNKLFELENVIVTPHCAALTRETSNEMSRMTAEGILDVLAGKPCRKAANPEVFRK